MAPFWAPNSARKQKVEIGGDDNSRGAPDVPAVSCGAPGPWELVASQAIPHESEDFTLVGKLFRHEVQAMVAHTRLEHSAFSYPTPPGNPTTDTIINGCLSLHPLLCIPKSRSIRYLEAHLALD